MDNQSITCTLEMPVPYSIHPKISEKGIVWKGKKRCKGDYRNIVQV